MASEPFLGFLRSKSNQNFPSSSSTHSTPFPPPQNPNSNSNKHKIHRCKTAPELVILPQNDTVSTDPKPNSSSLLRQASILLIMYLSLGIMIYAFNRDHFSGIETNPVVDALYFCIVTMCTIGYGDIAPVTPVAKLFSCFFVLVGFGFIDIMLSGVVNYVLDLQENIILNSSLKSNMIYNYSSCLNSSLNSSDNYKTKLSLIDYVFDFGKGRMRIRLKVCLALFVVILSIGIGTFVLYFIERLDWIDSLYLAVLSVTTVGYGDRAFRTVYGRLFASFWLLFSTLMVARAFLYLTEARIDKRHRRAANWVLHREITAKDLVDADINHNGFISKSEYIVFKLKEMGKIEQRDILQICDQFNKLDSSNSGKITLHRLVAGRSI